MSGPVSLRIDKLGSSNFSCQFYFMVEKNGSACENCPALQGSHEFLCILKTSIKSHPRFFLNFHELKPKLFSNKA